MHHPFSILMWFKKTEFLDFWDQSWRFLLPNIRAFIFVLSWVYHWFGWKLSHLSTVSKVCQALHINLKQRQSTWRDPRSWYHLTFTSIEGVKSDFCRACARLTFRNRIFCLPCLWSVTAISIPCIILLVGTEFCTWMPASSYAFFWSAVLIWSTVLSFIVSDITC